MPDDELLEALHGLGEHGEEPLDGARIISSARRHPRWVTPLVVALALLMLSGGAALWARRQANPDPWPDPLGNPSAAPLTGTDWLLTSVTDESGSWVDTSAATVVVRLDGEKVTVTDDVGFRMISSYRLSGDSLTIQGGQVGMPGVPSAPPGWVEGTNTLVGLPNEKIRVSVTGNTMTWRVDSRTLTFTDQSTSSIRPRIPVEGSWRLVEMTDSDGHHDVSAIETQLVMADDRATGKDPLNPFDCQYAVTGSKVTFTDCKVGGAGGAIEPTVLAAHALRGFRVITASSQPLSVLRSDQELVLKGKGITLTFRRQ
ncbi:hypothetical protein AAEX63_15030 [Luteococcus sp. H138]|uniref:hypothetical protein n=1 Tax=unclassified Luteococcus TaxID=2639923 RepID=UPI00313EC16C